MMGFGEAYFSAYAVWLKASNGLIGILGTIPPFVGACLQPLAAHSVERTGWQKRLTMVGASVQGLMFAPICISIFLPREIAYPLLLGSVVIYFAGVHFATPAWNALMGELVPAAWRGRYFGWRASVMVVAQCLATLLAGVGLHTFKRHGHEGWGFLLIFSAALVARAVSVAYLARMCQPPHPVRSERPSAVGEERIVTFRRFALFMAAMNFSVAVSGPYFVPYMLNDLHFTYFEFMLSSVVVVMVQVVVLQRWGGLGDRIGNKRILVVTGVGATIVPLLWLATRGPISVWCAQAFAGMVWGGFNLAAGNFLLDVLPREDRARGVARFNLMTGTGVFLGGLVGVAIVDLLPSRYTLGGLTVSFFSHLHVIMLISVLLRVLTLVLFLRRFREVREVPNVGVAEVLLRASAMSSMAEAAGDFLTWYRREKQNGES